MMPPTGTLAATYKVAASKTATHRPSDKTNITIQDAAGLSREEGFGSGLRSVPCGGISWSTSSLHAASPFLITLFRCAKVPLGKQRRRMKGSASDPPRPAATTTQRHEAKAQ